MSSQHNTAVASYAVDGNTNADWSTGCACTYANGIGTDDPWWAVDFGEQKFVVGVDVVNRGDCCGKW